MDTLIVFGKAIYRELGLANVRHRREASIEVMRRRLLSLDFVVDHPDLPWLVTEQEKVACFEWLGIGRELFPKRICHGRADGRFRYFHIKMPVAVEQDRAVFTYIAPGMGTHTELHSWGDLPTVGFGRRSAVPVVASRSLPLPGSSTYSIEPNVCSHPGAAGASPRPGRRPPCCARLSLIPIGRRLNAMAALMPS